MSTARGDERPVVPRGAMRRYLLALTAGGLLVLALIAATLGVLAARGSLPPPQFSNNLCLDEKLNFMHETPPVRPNLLVLGSSVAWRHFNSPAAVEAHAGLRPYNAGLCGASVAQTEAVVDWLESRLPTVERALLIASPVDFEDCAGDRVSRFDVAAADHFVFGGSWPARYYLRYFDPLTFAHNAYSIREHRSEINSFYTLNINGFGDGPIEPPRNRGLTYGKVDLDPACFAALGRIAKAQRVRNISFDVVVTPLNPEWRREFDADGSITDALDARIVEALAGTDATLLRVDVEPDAAAFFDAIHIRWSHTAEFTRALLSPAARVGL